MSVDYQIDGYDIGEEIGSGGMAHVFLAQQLSLSRQVAIKILHPHLTGGGDFKTRFLHEGQMLARLNHPNIVAIYDIGSGDQLSYMAMEYLQGGTLTERMREGMPLAEVIRVCTQIAHALSLAHSSHIVHRDLKPSNIMFRDEITPVLTDFGIARQMDVDHRLTKTGMVVGTPYYMSPEQLSGTEIDGRADIYSLGVMLFELLTGDLPFKAEEPLALAMQHVQQPPPPLPAELSDLQPVMDRMLAKKAEDRYGDMLDFCEDIKQLVTDNKQFATRLSGETKLFNSEQFADPRFTTGGRRRSGLSSGNAPATRVSDPGQRYSSRQGLPWKLISAIGLLLIVLAGGGYYYFTAKPDSGLSSENQQIVENLIKRVNGYIAVNQIDTPEDKNAVDTLRQIYQIAPDYPEARELAEQIIVYYQTDARISLDNNEIEQAMVHVQNGLALLPDNKNLLDLKFRIEEQQQQFENQLNITRLLTDAAARVEARQLVLPEGDSALHFFDQVLLIDALNETATRGRQQIQQTLIDQIEREIEAGQIELAATHLDDTEALFPGSSLVSRVRQDLQVVQQQALEQTRIETLLAEAGQYMEQGILTAADGNSALDRYQAVLRLQQDNAIAGQGLDDIASNLARQAAAALVEEDFQRAAELARNGLRANPESNSLLAIQDQAFATLGEQERLVETALRDGLTYEQQAQFFTPENANAYDSYQQVLALDPENTRAAQALSRLPDTVITTVEGLQRIEEFQQADDLLALATSRFSDSRFDSLREQIGVQLANQRELEALQMRLVDARNLINVRPFTRESVNAAADSIRSILSEYPNDGDAVRLLADFTRAVTDSALNLSERGDDMSALILIDYGLDAFPNNQRLTDAYTRIDGIREQRVVAEQARIAAISGDLAIDARPWGEVTEIRNQQGEIVDLPDNRITPFRLSLIEGQYTVTVEASGSAETQSLDVAILRQESHTLVADFQTMNADEYFSKANW